MYVFPVGSLYTLPSANFFKFSPFEVIEEIYYLFLPPDVLEIIHF